MYQARQAFLQVMKKRGQVTVRGDRLRDLQQNLMLGGGRLHLKFYFCFTAVHDHENTTNGGWGLGIRGYG